MKDIIEDSIIQNCEVRYEINDKKMMNEAKGQFIEVGMI